MSVVGKFGLIAGAVIVFPCRVRQWFVHSYTPQTGLSPRHWQLILCTLHTAGNI
jgi:hypothetical protein